MLPVVFLTLSKPKVFLFTCNYALDPQEILAPHFAEWKSNTCTPSSTIGEDNIFSITSREAGNTKVDILFWETFSKLFLTTAILLMLNCDMVGYMITLIALNIRCYLCKDCDRCMHAIICDYIKQLPEMDNFSAASILKG